MPTVTTLKKLLCHKGTTDMEILMEIFMKAPSSCCHLLSCFEFWFHFDSTKGSLNSINFNIQWHAFLMSTVLSLHTEIMTSWINILCMWQMFMCDVICDVMWCDAMRCDAMRCDAMRCDAMWCDVDWCLWTEAHFSINPYQIWCWFINYNTSQITL